VRSTTAPRSKLNHKYSSIEKHSSSK
jgi:hypothetical protein